MLSFTQKLETQLRVTTRQHRPCAVDGRTPPGTHHGGGGASGSHPPIWDMCPLTWKPHH